MLLLLLACTSPPTENIEAPQDTQGSPPPQSEPPIDCLLPPNATSPSPPTDECKRMDWQLSPDGWYLVSEFGTDADRTTWGERTTCSWLQATYDYYGCRYNSGEGLCLDDQQQIPWVQGHVDYALSEVLAAVEQANGGDVPWPEVFYVAGAQRYGCGALLRVSNPANGRCVVVYAEDGGPGAQYEGADYGGRHILDSSPAVIAALDVQRHGWSNSELLYVSFGQPGDVPGARCEPCGGTPAMRGHEDQRSPWDPEHMTGVDCR